MTDLRVSRSSRQEGVVDVVGDLDADSAWTHRAELLALCPRDGTTMVLNLARVRSCEPAGLTLLINAQQRVTAAGGKLALVAPSFASAKTLRVTGLASSFSVYATVRAARHCQTAATAATAAPAGPVPARPPGGNAPA